jgi:hypothetical protein
MKRSIYAAIPAFYIIRAGASAGNEAQEMRRGGLSVAEDPAAYGFVAEGLDNYRSPGIIADQWKERHPSRPLAHSTIYRTITCGVLKKEYPAKKHLRRHGSATIKPDHMIRERPLEAENRDRLEDIEGIPSAERRERAALSPWQTENRECCMRRNAKTATVPL